MGIAPAAMIHSHPQSWTARTVGNIVIKCVSTGIGWNATIRHLRLLTKPAAALGVGSWPLCSVRRLPGEITVLKCGGAEKMKKTRIQFPIILTNTTDSSYLGRIQVKQCWKPNFTAIKLTPLSEVGVFYFFCNICSAYCYWSFNSPPLDTVETNSPHNHSPRSYR